VQSVLLAARSPEQGEVARRPIFWLAAALHNFQRTGQELVVDPLDQVIGPAGLARAIVRISVSREGRTLVSLEDPISVSPEGPMPAAPAQRVKIFNRIVLSASTIAANGSKRGSSAAMRFMTNITTTIQVIFGRIIPAGLRGR
jgi:hypothetical protein